MGNPEERTKSKNHGDCSKKKLSFNGLETSNRSYSYKDSEKPGTEQLIFWLVDDLLYLWAPFIPKLLLLKLFLFIYEMKLWNVHDIYQYS